MPKDVIPNRYKDPNAFARIRPKQRIRLIQPATKTPNVLKPSNQHHRQSKPIPIITTSKPNHSFRPSSKSPPHSILPSHPHVPKTPPTPIHPSHLAPPAPHSSTPPAWPPFPAHTPSSSSIPARARRARWAPSNSRSRAPTQYGSCSPSCAWNRPAAATRRKGSDSRVRRRGACQRGWRLRKGRRWC